MTYVAILVQWYSLMNGLDPQLVHSVIKVESGYRIRAVGSAKEQGLMQVKGKYYALGPVYKKDSLFDPAINITIGTSHLKDVQERCSGMSGHLWVVCYNRGVRGAKRLSPQERREHFYYKKVMMAYNE